MTLRIQLCNDEKLFFFFLDKQMALKLERY